MEPALAIVWLPDTPTWTALREVIREGLPNMVVHFFATPEEAQRYTERSLLEGKSIFLFIAPLPNGEEFLVESLKRWPLAYALGLTHESDFTVEVGTYLVAYLNGQPSALRPYLHQLVRRYEERRQSEQQKALLAEIHRVSLSLTGEVRLEWLIFKLLRLALENSGAPQAFLIVPEDESSEALLVAGYAEAGDYEPRPYPPRPLAQEMRLFLPAIYHTVRTRENLFILPGKEHPLWHRHPEWERFGLEALLCLPLIYQGRLMGLLYLPNPNTEFFTTPEKLEFLKLFTAPGALALQNAQLYAEMEARVRERTQEVLRQKEEIERQSALLRQQNEDILASLRYAQRVQRAIFPPWSELQKTLPESFLFYHPREIVGGDFYWFAQRLSKIVIAVGDCTGHGIPGAFMTIIANTLLKQIVELEGVFKPSEILYLLNLRMRAALQHEDAQYQRFREGMEIALIQLDPKRHKLLYAGAGRPLFLVRQGKGQEILPDRLTIGTSPEGEAPEFTLHALDLQPGDTLFLFSDGFADQLNPEGKRYQLRRLYELFEVIAEQSAARQQVLLEAELERWRQNARQTDDILIIGLRIP
ncbi:MAG: SpoIIE family protein phosphatase [Bacteroidia bacterium]|nr:SpoIIE family protein phosphatase [Bacteroidia bacterium]MDW8088600.1 SpoIIE family protein phosphatase [Bacteroidia bacterium]